MKSNQNITITNNEVILYTGSACITIHLDTNSKNLVAINRDSGGPTETIPRKREKRNA